MLRSPFILLAVFVASLSGLLASEPFLEIVPTLGRGKRGDPIGAKRLAEYDKTLFTGEDWSVRVLVSERRRDFAVTIYRKGGKPFCSVRVADPSLSDELWHREMLPKVPYDRPHAIRKEESFDSVICEEVENALSRLFQAAFPVKPYLRGEEVLVGVPIVVCLFREEGAMQMGTVSNRAFVRGWGAEFVEIIYELANLKDLKEEARDQFCQKLKARVEALVSDIS